jgi:tetratricopeptide (TPR) repeat protein
MAGGQLTSMLDMVKVSDSTPDEMLLCGIALHRAKSYPEAIESLKAWQNSQNADVKPQVPDGIVALGIAYSFCGRLNEAREIFESALLRDPEYPLFHYNLACVFALQNKPSVMLEQLKLAKQFRGNLEPDVPLSNPANNSSFKRFLENPVFKEVCKDWPQ